MKLFHFLKRRVAARKIKITQKWIDRVKQPKPPKSRNGGVARLSYAALAAGLMLATSARAGESSGYSAAMLFNQANAYARAGKTGPAILNYERAQLLAPNDPDIAANLHFVRTKAGLPDAQESWVVSVLNRAPPDTLAWLGSLGLVLAGLLLLRVYPERRFAFRAATVAGVLLAATAIGSAATRWPTTKEAVVTDHDVQARTSPAPSAEALFKLREGDTVTVRAEDKNFALVQTSTGGSGWVNSADISRVIPRHNRG
jgi:hypothetical protein